MSTRAARADERAAFIRQYRADLRDSITASWRDHAACKESPSWMWFADADSAAPRAALAICHTCPVREKCLDHALEFEPYGIWGGMTQRQLTTLRHARGIAATPGYTP